MHTTSRWMFECAWQGLRTHAWRPRSWTKRRSPLLIKGPLVEATTSPRKYAFFRLCLRDQFFNLKHKCIPSAHPARLPLYNHFNWTSATRSVSGSPPSEGSHGYHQFWLFCWWSLASLSVPLILGPPSQIARTKLSYLTSAHPAFLMGKYPEVVTP